MKSDETLYYEYLDGDDEALAELLRRYDEGLELFIFSFVRNAEDAEELALDAFASLAAGDRRFQGRSTFRTWLFAIGRNLARQHLRRHRIKAGALYSEEPADEETPDMLILGEEKRRQLYASMEQLKSDYQEVLYLKYFESMTVAEMARVLGKSERKISDLIYRGKQSLKRVLEKEGFEYEDI